MFFAISVQVGQYSKVPNPRFGTQSPERLGFRRHDGRERLRHRPAVPPTLARRRGPPEQQTVRSQVF